MVESLQARRAGHHATLDGDNTGANTISGVLADNGSGQLAVTKSGSGLWILSGANSYSGRTTVLAGTLRFNIASGTPTIAAGATAAVASGATLELAGSVSALGAAGGNRVNVTNGSTAPGLLVSGTGQIVGGIDGTGDTQVNDGSDLTADHIIQNALIIGGSAGVLASVTIAASDFSGNPLSVSSAFAVSGSLQPRCVQFKGARLVEFGSTRAESFCNGPLPPILPTPSVPAIQPCPSLQPYCY